MSGRRLGYRDTDALIHPGFFAQRDQIGPVYDQGRIGPGVDEHSDAPLQYWREYLRRKRQQERFRKDREKEMPAKDGDEKPPGTIDEYV